jgi:hypothetical protein
MENYNDKNDSKLDPNFVTGLTDAEWCFSVNVRKDKRAKFNKKC